MKGVLGIVGCVPDMPGGIDEGPAMPDEGLLIPDELGGALDAPGVYGELEVPGADPLVIGGVLG